jgi:NADH:ubiquinone oxidoreductase subunit F (NADH-binding)/(2Fe-2S) ferredoxin/NAD-dependent dihydropyrimidine dehydrogenase PreA subunit
MTKIPTSFADSKALMKYVEAIRKEKKKIKKEIRVCGGPGCVATGSKKVLEELDNAIVENSKELKSAGYKLDTTFVQKCTGCQGMCEAGPVVTVEPDGIFYSHVKPAKAKEIITETILKGEPVEEFLYRLGDVKGGSCAHSYSDIPFYALQNRIALRNVGAIDPMSFEDFLANGGFEGFVKAVTEMTPEEVIDVVDQSGLRGRGGGGFSTGRKWKSAMSVKQDRMWIICNGDEGDPGAFMDRTIMDSDPYSVIEGMMIGAYALGATEGYIYVRHEYPLAVKHLNMAIDNLTKLGLLGENILGTGINFTLKLSRGGGAFVCGESSALMRSIEGKVGEPRAKYVRSVAKGLHDEPTVLNNAETFVVIPAIISRGAQWFASIGTERSKGTKVFSLVGKVKHTGLVEVPMGRTLREIIYDIGGGILDDRPFKAVQTGGPSGGCLPLEKIDLPVDFDTLTREGAMMGSGGMVVMDDYTCMVDVARYFTKFLVDESCGKCTPCRDGLVQLLNLLEKICDGKGTMADLDKIEHLSKTIEVASLCGLGKSAPFPVLSTLKYFRDEYIEHIEKKVCRAGVCKSLIRYDINKDCNGCTVCAKKCPVDAITGEKKGMHYLDTDKCIECGICMSVCKFESIDIYSGDFLVTNRETQNA